MALAVALIWLTFGAVVLAHGRFPSAGLVVTDPNNSDRLMVVTTYGVLRSDDHGGTWAWVCSEAPGYDADLEDPIAVFDDTGRTVIGVFDGLSVGSKDACDWQLVGGALKDLYFVDVVRESTPGALMALSSMGLGQGQFDVRLWASEGDALTWSELPTDGIPPTFLGLSLAVAQSDPGRVYVSGREYTQGTGEQSEATLEGVIHRSEDRGKTWSRVFVPGATEQRLPYLAGVSAADPDALYVGVLDTPSKTSISYQLIFSPDGGESWQTLVERDRLLGGFALSPDGKQIAIGGEEDGLLIADIGEWKFEKVSDLKVRCLRWTERALYACADPFVDGFSLGASTDGGLSFEPLMNLSSPCGIPKGCGEQSKTAIECAPRWPTEKVEIGATDCDGGEGGQAGQPPVSPGSTGSGCGCWLAGQGQGVGPDAGPERSGAPWHWWPFGAVAVLFLSRRRRVSRRRDRVRA